MAPRKPKDGDAAVYRGKRREIVTADDGDGICTMVNPETRRNTYVRTQDLRWSDYLGAWFPFGLILSREEAALYSAFMGLGQIVPADAHERAVKILDDEDLDQELDEQTIKRLNRFSIGYWKTEMEVDEDGEEQVKKGEDGNPIPVKKPAEIISVVKDRRANRQGA